VSTPRRREFSTTSGLTLIRTMAWNRPISTARQAALSARLCPCASRTTIWLSWDRGLRQIYAYQSCRPMSSCSPDDDRANCSTRSPRRQDGAGGALGRCGFDESQTSRACPRMSSRLSRPIASPAPLPGQRGAVRYCSIAMFGTPQPVDVMVRSSHLFAPMPNTIRDDMAFLDASTSICLAGKCQDANPVPHRPLRLRGGLPGRALHWLRARTIQRSLTTITRWLAPECARCQGRPETVADWSSSSILMVRSRSSSWQSYWTLPWRAAAASRSS